MLNEMAAKTGGTVLGRALEGRLHGLRGLRSGPPRGCKAPLAFPYENTFCMGLLYGRTGRLTTENGDFRPGQGARHRRF